MRGYLSISPNIHNFGTQEASRFSPTGNKYYIHLTKNLTKMGFLKKLFTGKDDTEEEKQEKNFDILKYDGIKAISSCGCNIDYAIACFNRALDIKDDTETRTYLAKAHMAKGDLQEAAEQYRILMDAEPNEPLHPIRLAQVAYQMEDYGTMGEACRQALEINGTLAMPHHLLAMKAKAQGDLLNAIVESTKAISAKEDFYDAYMLRAQTLCAMQQFAEAEKDIDLIMENAEPTEDIVMEKARISAALGKADEAATLFRQIIEYNPFSIGAYVSLATVLTQQDKCDDAIALISDGLEQMPDCAELYKARGAVKYHQGDKTGAAEDMKRALELAPEEAERLSGEYTNFKEKMLEAYNAINPYNFGVKI